MPLPVVFPTWARIALGLVVAFLGYLVGGELAVSEELRGAITSITLLVASAGIVPPKPGDLVISPTLRYALTTAVVAGGYVLNVVVDIDPTVRGLIVAALALAASVGIVPPQAQTTTVPR